MECTAVSHGAATIVNAIANGKGAAYGIRLQTKANVGLDNTGEIRGEILGEKNEDTRLIETCVKKVLNFFGKNHGATVRTESNIPIARGLKSSSVAANATVLATLGALGKKMPDLQVVRLGVDAALEAKVSITGAFDDACASYFGNAVVTNNLEKKLEKKYSLPKNLVSVIHYPAKKSYTTKIDKTLLPKIRQKADQAWELALEEKTFEAIMLNSQAYCEALGHDEKPVELALKAGAKAAGLSGKGPAFSALSEKTKSQKIVDAWSVLDGKTLVVDINTEKAKIVEKRSR